MQKSAWFLLVLFILVSACAKKEASPALPEQTSQSQDSEFKVALLTPGPVSDSGWSALANEGLIAIRDQLGATTNQQEARGTQIKDAMRSYAQEGYDLIIGHGFEYNGPAFEVAKDFPNTTFVSSSGSQTSKNVGAFRFYLEQGFYLAGIFAASMSKTGVIAMIGGPDVPSIRSTFKAFRAGAEFVNPKIRVIETFTGEDADVAKAKQATLIAIGEGADFVIHQANAAAQGVFDACKDKGVFALGANLNQNENPSGRVMASAVVVAEPAFVAVAKSVKDKTYEGSITSIGMDQKAIEFIYNPAFDAAIPNSVKELIQKTKEAIEAKRLIVPKDKF